MTIRVLLVDDEELVRSGLTLILRAENDIDVIGECGDGFSAVEAAERLQPDVVVMDVRMPHMDGIVAAGKILEGSRRWAAPCAVLVLTSFDVDEAVFAALRVGVAGFVLKHRTVSDLVHAIRTVAAGDVAMEPRIVRMLVERHARELAEATTTPRNFKLLTSKEREVLLLAAEGLSNQEIAQSLFIELGTAKTHMSHILAKLGVRDRAQAIAYVYRHNLFTQQ